MTLVARDEADIVEQQVRYHLEAGVDFVIASDHASVDGTTEILRRFEKASVLRLIRREEEGFFQSAWVTEMARLAATEYAADWVINSDADEFWWPRRETLRQTLESVSPNFGAIRGLWRHFALRPEGRGQFHERMTARRQPVRDPLDPYHAQVKVAHRAKRSVVIPEGNHDAVGDGLRLAREWFPFEVLHFPIRSRAQLERKYVAGWRGHSLAADSHPPRHIEAVAQDLGRRPLDEVYADFVVTDDDLERGLAVGKLTIDTRLRDALNDGGPTPSASTLEDDVGLAIEIDTFLETDAARRLAARIDPLERRLARVESSAAVVLTQRLHRRRQDRKVTTLRSSGRGGEK
jgi:hypothetical protein